MEILAHRGESYIAPENTLAAFNLAWEKGAKAVELDIYLTPDKQIVVHHDGSTKRTAGVDVKISETDSNELRKLDFGKLKDERYTGEKIAFLSEALATIPADGKMLVEIKCGPEIVPYLERVLDESGKRSQVVIISFNLDSCVAAKKQMPDVQVYLLGWSGKDDAGELKPYSHDLIKTALDNNLDGLDLHYPMVTKEYVDAIKAAGLAIWTWTVNDPADAKKQLEMGVDGMATDRAAWITEQL